jgi:hypothetical protein
MFSNKTITVSKLTLVRKRKYELLCKRKDLLFWQNNLETIIMTLKAACHQTLNA